MANQNIAYPDGFISAKETGTNDKEQIVLNTSRGASDLALHLENLEPTEDESEENQKFGGIVGQSSILLNALKLVRMVGPTESTVLIEGETGTGKELIAGAIHFHSKRRDRPFIKVNCAAIPSGLIESELFGHERGAFTGALARKPGRFESCDRGTLFLDEIGDLPLELQVKLLRVLQEGEFERLGGTQTIRVDVRLIAATNASLSNLVSEKKFRSDLYYRLNVFPISVPPLRERVEDIPALVMHFVAKYASQMRKPVEKVSLDVMNALAAYSWPGNIRELQNFIERSVILSSDDTLCPPLHTLKPETRSNSLKKPLTLMDAERDHICRALSHTKGVVAGPNGAAARLGMKRSTLYFRMRKLGIANPREDSGNWAVSAA